MVALISVIMFTLNDLLFVLGRRAYAGFASSSAQVDNDVYRVDDNAARSLSAVTRQGIWSVSYAGTVASGTLFEGRIDMAEVKYSTDSY